MAATADEVTADDYPWDLDQMPIAPDEVATDAALDALDDANPGQRATVRRVHEMLTGDRPSERVSTTDWARALQHAPDVVAVAWDTGGFDEVSWDGDRSTFVVAGYSALQDIHGEEPHYCEAVGRDRAEEMLHSAGLAVTVDEAALLEQGGDNGGDEA